MFYQVTTYTRYDIKPRRIRWKLDKLSKEIPKEYSRIASPNERLRKALREEPIDYDKLNDPVILKKCRQFRKYMNMFRKSPFSRINTPSVDGHFNNIENALEYVKNFDDERGWYQWLKIEEVYPIDDEVQPRDDGRWEKIGWCLVDTHDRWFKLEVTEVGEYVEGWGWTYDHTYTETEPPIYLKGHF